MSTNNTINTKSNFQDLPEIPVNQKLSAGEVNQITDFQKVPVQKIDIAFVDTDIIIDGTKSYSNTKVVTAATHTITASDDDAIADTLSSEHRQGNNIKTRYQFDQDCTITLIDFDTAGNNTGTITPIPAGIYNLQFFANASGVNLEISQNVHGDDTTKLSKTLTPDQVVVSNVEFPKVAIGVSTFLNSLDVAGGMAVGSGYAGLQTAPTDGAIIEGPLGVGIPDPNAIFEAGGAGAQFMVIRRTDSTTAAGGWEWRGSDGLKDAYIQYGVNVGQAITIATGAGNPITRMTILNNGRIGNGTTSPLAQNDIDQSSTTAAIPVIRLDQADISEEMIEFETTIGVGNPIEAKGAKTFTETHFIKVTLPGGLTRYIPAGTIA